MNRALPISHPSFTRPADGMSPTSSVDLQRAVEVSWNRIRYFHVGRRHAYALPPRNDNAPRRASDNARFVR